MLKYIKDGKIVAIQDEEDSEPKFKENLNNKELEDLKRIEEEREIKNAEKSKEMSKVSE
jgi:hypothetical protein